MSYIYTSGSSDEDENMQKLDASRPPVGFGALTKEEQEDMMIYMWTRVCTKLRASLYIVQACAHLHKTLYLKGSQKREKLYAETQEEEKPHWFIIK